MPPRNTTRWLRAGTAGFVLLALAATAVEVGQDGAGPPADPQPTVLRDPLAAELERCNAMTPTSPRDEACEQAWAENRRRFLGVPPNAARVVPGDAAAQPPPTSHPGGRP